MTVRPWQEKRLDMGIDMEKAALTIHQRALWQAFALVLLASLIAIGVNQWRRDGIALIGDWSVAARVADTGGNSLVIDLSRTAALFQRQEVLLVDARPENQYAVGHIRGALSLPWPEAEQRFIEAADRLAGAKAIVTYCDGENCDLSHKLALFLKEMGFDNVRVLVNGWSLWRQAGLPTDGGR